MSAFYFAEIRNTDRWPDRRCWDLRREDPFDEASNPAEQRTKFTNASFIDQGLVETEYAFGPPEMRKQEKKDATPLAGAAATAPSSLAAASSSGAHLSQRQLSASLTERVLQGYRGSEMVPPPDIKVGVNLRFFKLLELNLRYFPQSGMSQQECCTSTSEWLGTPRPMTVWPR